MATAEQLEIPIQPVNQMIEVSVSLLLESIERPNSKPTAHVIPGELIRRGSARLATMLG